MTTNETPDKLTEEFENLIQLLDDEDENIYGNIKQRFLSHGFPSSQFLKNYSGSENILIKKRASEIISIINFEETEQKFLRLINNDDPYILEEAIFLIATLNYPSLDINKYISQLDTMASDLKKIYSESGSSEKLNTLEKLNIINEYLFFKKGFRGNEENYYDPDNSYMNKVMDEKKGIPVTLSILYLLVTRRLDLPVYGLSLPGHFILKYSDENEEFFIDPFNKGIIISIKEAQKFIKNIGMTDEEFKGIPYLKNSTDREITLRVMRNLSEIYKKTGELLKTEQIDKIMSYFV
ncbi:MAG TPA: transglutaminase-like domain-containing protein [Ignavibacteria bacterium]|nr:transglutaminase-like domain-containing protein [Ignavibacteria bacterium]HMR41544.1 transglutaminase-like domain-containing protein [Ignavibacteria bacterium]